MQIRDVVAMTTPLPKLAEKTTSFGYFNIPSDSDGIMRRVRMLNKHGDKLYPALSLATVARYFDADIRPLNGTTCTSE